MSQLYGNDGRAVVVKNDGKNKKHSGEKNKQNDGDLESMVIDKLKMMKVEYNDNAKSIFNEKIALRNLRISLPTTVNPLAESGFNLFKEDLFAGSLKLLLEKLGYVLKRDFKWLAHFFNAPNTKSGIN